MNIFFSKAGCSPNKDVDLPFNRLRRQTGKSMLSAKEDFYSLAKKRVFPKVGKLVRRSKGF